MNEYAKQAEEFLTSTGTSLEVRYLYTGPYFDRDDEYRDVYQFTLSNKRGSYSGTFGDSIYNTRRRTTKRKPSAYDILACLRADYPVSFKEFCAEYGYDPDSCKAMRIHRACLEERAGLERIFTPEELERLGEIS